MRFCPAARPRRRLGLLIALALLSSTLPVLPVVAQEEVQLSDDFADPGRGLLPTSSAQPAQYSLGYVDGEYRIENLQAVQGRIAAAPIPGIYSDVELAADVRLVGETAGRIALITCRQQSGLAYRISIEPDARRVQLRLSQGEGGIRILAQAVSNAVRTGNESNQVEMRCIGTRIDGLVNGVRVVTAVDSTFSEGQANLALSRTSVGDARFDNLTLRVVPTSAGAAAAAMSAAAEAAAPSVLQVLAGRGRGSGVRVAQGILTNAHVVADDVRVELIRQDGERAEGIVTRLSTRMDLALVRTDLAVPALTLRPPGGDRRGERVTVLGYSAGVLAPMRPREGTVVGVIGAQDMLAVGTDAVMNPGDSGGAMIDGQGRLMAVNDFGLRGPEGINFGLASETVEAFLSSESDPIPDPWVAEAGELLLVDDFDDPDASALSFLVRSRPEAASATWLQEGELWLSAADTGTMSAWLPGLQGDSALAVDVRLVGENEGRSVALLCRGAAATWGYALRLIPDEQAVLLTRWDAGQLTHSLKETSEAIRPGTETNRLEFHCGGTTLAAWVNGTWVTELEDSSFRQGIWFVLVGNSDRATLAAFDNLVITQL